MGEAQDLDEVAPCGLVFTVGRSCSSATGFISVRDAASRTDQGAAASAEAVLPRKVVRGRLRQRTTVVGDLTSPPNHDK
ncbi:hypothetical protein [Streptomyces sp. NPDC002088]|uniref:hypothetical protein n=1 Tax=Streptomyces sp. NPDC002088 TaxID=3154665 RepID=UPI00332279CD